VPDQHSELLYLEPDDEITAVVRRIRASAAERIVLVASGRSKATSSAIALRLLARVAADEQRMVVLVADPVARALAAEAGLAAFTTVAEANAEGAVPEPTPTPHRATIRVIRDAEPSAPLEPAARSTPGDETQAVSLPAPAPTPPRRRSNGPRGVWRASRRATLLLAAVAVIALAALAAILPAAAVTIAPATQAIGPRQYSVEPEVHGPDEVSLQSTKSGQATGEHLEQVPATGTVTFFNWNGPSGRVTVPAGTVVSGGGASFRTVAEVVVPGGHFAGGPIESGEADVAVTAVAGGPGGNVAARVIDTVETAAVAAALSGPFGITPVVGNAAPTTGGDEVRHVVIEQADVNAVVAAIQGDLRSQIAARIAANPERVYPEAASDLGTVNVPGDLVGTEDQETFQLSGSYRFSRSYVQKDEIETAAAAALEADAAAVPATLTLVTSSIEVSWGTAQQVGGTIRVPVTVSARASAQVDLGAVRQRILGMTPAEARTELADLGSVGVELWPGWVDRIPRLDWRVSVEIVSE
jgi:Baseplate J-like protein